MIRGSPWHVVLTCTLTPAQPGPWLMMIVLPVLTFTLAFRPNLDTPYEYEYPLRVREGSYIVLLLCALYEPQLFRRTTLIAVGTCFLLGQSPAPSLSLHLGAGRRHRGQRYHHARGGRAGGDHQGRLRGVPEEAGLHLGHHRALQEALL